MVVKKKASPVKKRKSGAPKKKTVRKSKAVVKTAGAHPKSAKVVPLAFAKHWKIGAAVAAGTAATAGLGGLAYHKRANVRAFLNAVKQLEKSDFTEIPEQIATSGRASLTAAQKTAEKAANKLKDSWKNNAVVKALGDKVDWISAYFKKAEAVKK